MKRILSSIEVPFISLQENYLIMKQKKTKIRFLIVISVFIFISLSNSGFSQIINLDTTYLNSRYLSDTTFRNSEGIINDPELRKIEDKLRNDFSLDDYTYNGKVYPINGLEQLFDSLLVDFSLWKRMPKVVNKEDEPWVWEIKNSECLEIKNKINALPNDTNAFYSKASDNIQKRIYALNDIEQSVNAFLYLANHFYRQDMDYKVFNYCYNKCFKIINQTRDKMLVKNNYKIIGHAAFKVESVSEGLSAEELSLINCNITIGEFSVKNGYLNAGLSSFLSILDQGDLENRNIFKGEAEEKIAKLFRYREGLGFNDEAETHYKNAFKIFWNSKDSIRTALVTLKLAGLYWSQLLNRYVFYYDKKMLFLQTLFNLNIFKENGKLPNKYLNYYYASLGYYFSYTGNKKDQIIAKQYFQKKLISSLKPADRSSLDILFYSLIDMAWINSLLKDKEQTTKYNNLAIKLANDLQDSVKLIYSFYEQASNLNTLGNHLEGLSFFYKGFEIENKLGRSSTFGLSTASWLYWALFKSDTTLICYRDSANKYGNLYYNVKGPDFSIELNELIAKVNNQKIEKAKRNDIINKYVISDMQLNYDKLANDYDYTKIEYDILKPELINLKKNIAATNAKAHKDSIIAKRNLEKAKDDLLIAKRNLDQSTDDLVIAKRNIDKTNDELTISEKAKEMAYISFCIISFLSILVGYLSWKKRRKYLKQTNKLLKEKQLEQHLLKVDIEAKNNEILVKNIEIENKQKITFESNLRAAISQLYARTDSHDLGHVLDAYKSFNDFISDETKGQYMYVTNNLLTSQDKTGYLDEAYNFIQDGKTIRIYPKLQGNFNQFLKTRMDFRADVATTDPNSLTTLDFYQDIFIPFNNNLIFNNRISGIADKTLKYSFQIFKGNKEITKEDKLPIAIPNDILGCQAMYIVWSNVIRNTVKHSELKDNEKRLVLSIQVNDYLLSHDYFEISFFTSIFREKSFIDDLVSKRNKSFDSQIWNEDDIDHKGRLRDNSLGSIEMATCAAYLRKLAVTEVDNPIFKLFNKDGEYMNGKPYTGDGSVKPMIMYAYSQPKQYEKGIETQYSLGYKFYLLKPKEILVVCNQPDLLSNTLVDNADKNVLSQNGIDFIKPDELGGRTFNHKFIAFFGTQTEFDRFQKFNKLMTGSLPKRQVIIDPSNTFEYVPDFIKECWDNWLNQYHKSVNIFRCFESDETLVFPEKTDLNASFNVHLYQHHEGLYQQTTSETFNKLKDGNYHEMMCGHHWTRKNLLENLTINDFKSSEYAEPYIECIFTNVIVIDERIQKTIVVHSKKYADKIPFTTYFNQMGVFIPSELNEGDPDLNKTTLMEEKARITDYIKRYIDKSSFIVVHLGILEKLLTDKNDKSDDAIDVILNEIISGESNRKKVVITSGRGKANNVKPDISYVPISLIQNAIETTFDKYRLIQILFNSRKSL